MKIQAQFLYVSLIIILLYSFAYAIERTPRNENITDMDILLTGEPDFSKGYSDETKTLATAARNGDVEQVKLLLKKGADANATMSTDGSTVLTAAVVNGNADIVKSLIENGGNVHQKGAFGTVLILAVEEGHKDIVGILLENGADVNEAPNVYTPLMLATRKGNAEIVKLLVEKGADVKMKVNTGYYEITALQIAKNFGRPDIVEILERAGAKE